MWKKMFESAGVFLCTVVLTLSCMAAVGYLVNDDTQSYTRVAMHELYEQKKIDSVFLGASHVYRGVNPRIVDEVWNENTFNLSTSSQWIDGSYALLKEADKVGGIKRCYLELSVIMVYWDKEMSQKDVTASYIISDYMKPSLNKIMYLLNAFEPENYMDAFCPARRNWRKIFSFGYLWNTISGKRQGSYKEYAYVENETEYYAGKGFVYSKNIVSYTDQDELFTITENHISDDYLSYFSRIVRYCQENNIELICFAVPMTEVFVDQLEGYDSYLKQAMEACEKFGVPYYDFNCANPSVLNLQDSDFKDQRHLNGKGAEKFSKVFADFFAGKIQEQELFFESYAEKRKYGGGEH